MKLGIAAFAADGGKSGIGQYLVNVIPRLTRLEPTLRTVIFIARSDYALLAGQVEPAALVAVPDWMARPAVNVLWHLLLLPLLLKRHACDCVWLPAGNRRLGWWYGVPSVATVHDLSQLHVQEKYDALRMFYVKRVLPTMMRRLDRVVAVSESTRRDLEQYAGVPAERIVVAYNGADLDRFGPARGDDARRRAAAALGTEAPFILYTARLEHPGKNHVRLLQALAQLKARGSLRHKLVLAGSPWHGAAAITAEVERLGLQDDVIFTGFVPDQLLPSLYAAADLFVFPSLFEGFGIPLLEAMISGTPVCAADVSSIPEVTGDAALLFDPGDAAGIASAMARLLDDAPLARQLVQRGLAQARRFSWDQAAAGVLAQCRQAAAP